jgi:hypothetical protein
MGKVKKKRRITPKHSIEDELQSWVVDTCLSCSRDTKVFQKKNYIRWQKTLVATSLEQ